MAYVALSRARNLQSVHLIDFNENVLKCEELAINEYNKLRKKLNKKLAQFDKYNMLPSDNITNKNSSNLQHLLKMDAISISNDIIKKKKKSLKRINSIDFNKENKKIKKTENYYIALDNDNTSACFANSVLQLLISCGDNLFQKVLNCVYFIFINIFENFLFKVSENFKETIILDSKLKDYQVSFSYLFAKYIQFYKRQTKYIASSMELRKFVDFLSKTYKKL